MQLEAWWDQPEQYFKQLVSTVNHFGKEDFGSTVIRASQILRICLFSGQAGSLRMLTTGRGASSIHSESNPDSELNGATFLWAVNLNSSNLDHQMLIVSFVQATRALATGNSRFSVVLSLVAELCPGQEVLMHVVFDRGEIH